MLNDEEAAGQRAEQLGLPYLNFHQAQLDDQLRDLFPEAVARSYRMLPWRQEGERLRVAMVDPRDPVARDIAQTLAGTAIDVVVVSESALKARLREVFPGLQAETLDDVDIAELSPEELVQELDSPPIVRLARLILTLALQDGASRVHLEPYGQPARIRFRTDGRLVTVLTPPAGALFLVLNRFKLMGQLDMHERRIPQSGKMTLNVDGHNHEIHLHCLPTLRGEKLVLHLVHSTRRPHLEDLNMDPETLRSWGRDLQRSRGLLLVTGPPDSGKTTTIYASLRRMVNEQRNLTTIEPHVYETIDLVNQIQLNPKAGLVFSSALRNAALQDCDAIFISELHGSDVAQLALEVAHRNCLVLAIVHDEYAAGAVGHLLRMYAEPALVSGALKGVLAQHLLVRLCPSCKRPAAPDEELLQRLSLQPSTILMEAPGCQACQGSGRASGRLAVFEYLPMTPQLSQQILSQRDRFEAQPSSLPTRILELLQAGEIGLEEALPHLSYPR